MTYDAMINKPAGHTKGGRMEREITEELIERIVLGFTKTMVLTMASGHSGVSRYLITKWLKQGDEDITNFQCTLYATLFERVQLAFAQKAELYIAKLETCPANYGSLTWLLQVCIRNEYAQESEEHKELRELYGKLLADYQNLLANKDAVNNRQVDA